MPRPPVDLTRKIKDILLHVQPLPDEAKAPILHYRRTVADIWGALGYVERAIGQRERYQTVVARHLGRVYGMALVNLVETFERFLKEVAAECVDCLADLVVDDRFNVFKIQGSALASHFGMSLVWQIRHTAVHNVGVITQSDAVRLRVWAREPVAAPRLLTPTRGDLNYLKRFLDETASDCNQRIGDRLAQLLTLILPTAPISIAPQDLANRVTAIFRRVLQVAGADGVLPPD